MCITTQVRWFSAETRSSGAIGCGRGSDRRWRLLVLYGEARLRESGTLDPRNNRGVPRGGWVSYAGSILILSRATRKGWARVVSSRTVWNLCPMGITMGVCFFPSLQLKTKTKTFFIHLRNLDFLWENLNSLAKLDFNCETWFCQKLCKWEWDGAMGSSSFWTCRARGKGWRRKSPVICWNHSALHFRSLSHVHRASAPEWPMQWGLGRVFDVRRGGGGEGKIVIYGGMSVRQEMTHVFEQASQTNRSTTFMGSLWSLWHWVLLWSRRV